MKRQRLYQHRFQVRLSIRKREKCRNPKSFIGGLYRERKRGCCFFSSIWSLLAVHNDVRTFFQVSPMRRVYTYKTSKMDITHLIVISDEISFVYLMVENIYMRIWYIWYDERFFFMVALSAVWWYKIGHTHNYTKCWNASHECGMMVLERYLGHHFNFIWLF